MLVTLRNHNALQATYCVRDHTIMMDGLSQFIWNNRPTLESIVFSEGGGNSGPPKTVWASFVWGHLCRRHRYMVLIVVYDKCNTQELK